MIITIHGQGQYNNESITRIEVIYNTLHTNDKKHDGNFFHMDMDNTHCCLYNRNTNKQQSRLQFSCFYAITLTTEVEGNGEVEAEENDVVVVVIVWISTSPTAFANTFLIFTLDNSSWTTLGCLLGDSSSCC